MRDEILRLEVEKKFPKHSKFYYNNNEFVVEYVIWDEDNRIVIIPTNYRYNDDNGWVDYYYENCLTKNDFRLQKIKRIIDE